MITGWTIDHPLEQVRGNPTMSVQTIRQRSHRSRMICSRSTPEGIFVITSHPEKSTFYRKSFVMDIKYKLRRAMRFEMSIIGGDEILFRTSDPPVPQKVLLSIGANYALEIQNSKNNLDKLSLQWYTIGLLRPKLDVDLSGEPVRLPWDHPISKGNSGFELTPFSDADHRQSTSALSQVMLRNVDEDTTLRLWHQLQQKYRCIRLSRHP
ncbi:hypothetical protein Tco_0289839 [Tanacetum coccineum]